MKDLRQTLERQPALAPHATDREDATSFSSVPLESVQAYWDSRPCNLLSSPSEVGTLQYFRDLTARKYFVEPHIPRFAEFERWRGKRVLEIGCGLGTDTISFAKAGAHVTAVDLSVESLALARKRAELEGVSVEFHHADAELLTKVIPPAPYDLVYSFGALHHTPHPERAIEQIRNYVEPGSTVKLMLYHRLSWKVASILLTQGRGAFWRLNRLIARYSEAQTGCPVTYTFTPDQVRRLLAGYEITDLWVDHIFPYNVRRYQQHQYVKAWPFTVMPQAATRWLERRFGWHLCVTAQVPGQVIAP